MTVEVRVTMKQLLETTLKAPESISEDIAASSFKDIIQWLKLNIHYYSDILQLSMNLFVDVVVVKSTETGLQRLLQSWEFFKGHKITFSESTYFIILHVARCGSKLF